MQFRLSIIQALLLAGMSLGVAGGVAADSSIAERVANQKSLRVSVEAGEGKFSRLAAADKTRLLEAQERMFEVVGDKTVTHELTESDMARLVAAESEIANIVAKLDPPAAKSKVVCSYEARLGSNRKERICRQVSSSDSAEARQTMQKMQSR